MPDGARATVAGDALEKPAPTHVHPRDAVVSAQRLTKRYGDLVAVDDLTFSLWEGTVTGFLGPNGAGKTTTLRCLSGIIPATRG